MVDNTESTNEIDVTGLSLFAGTQTFVERSPDGQSRIVGLTAKILAGTVSLNDREVFKNFCENSTPAKIAALKAISGLQEAGESIAPPTKSTKPVGWLSDNPVNQTEAAKSAPAAPNLDASGGIYPTDPDKQPTEPDPNKAKP